MKKLLNKLNFSAVFLLLLSLFATYIVFVNLGKPAFDNWDEAWSATATREMLRTKELIVLSWNKTMWLDKPPMYIWLSSLSSAIFGLSELSVRLPSAISGLVIIMSVLFYSYKKFGLIASVFAFSTIAFNNIFIWRLRSGNIDAFAALLIFISYFLITGSNKYRYPLLGIIFACLYLTKLSLVLFPLVIFLIYEILFKREEIKKNIFNYSKLFLIFLSISGAWLLLGYLKVGGNFLKYYLFYADQGLFSNIKINLDYLSYTYYSLQRRFFWLLVLGSAFILRKGIKSKNFILFLFAFVFPVILSFSDKNNNWYLIPAMPFWAIIIAYGTQEFLKLFKNKTAYFLATGALMLAGFYVSYKTFTTNIYPILNTTSAEKQAQSGKLLNKLSQKNEIIVRLDHLYPTTVYYTDRKVIASPPESDTKTYWISRIDLKKAIRLKKIIWITGTTKDVEEFIKNNESTRFEKITVNNEEEILKAL